MIDYFIWCLQMKLPQCRSIRFIADAHYRSRTAIGCSLRLSLGLLSFHQFPVNKLEQKLDGRGWCAIDLVEDQAIWPRIGTHHRFHFR